MVEHLMASPETMARLKRVFVESLHSDVRDDELPYEQMLEEAAVLDSVAVLEFVTAVEKEFGITLETELLEFDFLRDLSVLALYIEQRMEAHPGAESQGAAAPK
jgi:acyl carrier protein